MTLDEVKERLMRLAESGLSGLPQDFMDRHTRPEVTVVMLSYGRLEQTLNAIRALAEQTRIPFKLLLIENGSGDEMQLQLRQMTAGLEFLQLICLPQNLGASGGRVFALDHVQTPYVMFIDNDIEIFPGTVEQLLHRLELQPELVAVAGNVILPNGLVHLCGGDYQVANGILATELLGWKRPFRDPTIGESGPCKWVSGGLTMLKSEFFRLHPYDRAMEGYYEDLEWCYRLNELGLGAFYRQVEAIGLHYHEPKHLPVTFQQADGETSEWLQAVRCVESIARFYRLHGQVIQNLFDFIPELGPAEGPVSLASSRIILELINEQGGRWFTERLQRGRLAIKDAAEIGTRWRLEPAGPAQSPSAQDQCIDLLLVQLLDQSDVIRQLSRADADNRGLSAGESDATKELANVRQREKIRSLLEFADEQLSIRAIEQSVGYRLAGTLWAARRRLKALLRGDRRADQSPDGSSPGSASEGIASKDVNQTELGSTDPRVSSLENRSWEKASRAVRSLAVDVERRDDVAELLASLIPMFLEGTVAEKYFRFWEEHGFHLTPVHFYQPIPDTRTLTNDLWASASEMVGVNLNETAQVRLLTEVFPRYRSEYDDLSLLPTGVPEEFYLTNGLFEATDALVLYCIIRHFQPNRILEVGSGFSTRILAAGALRNGHTTLTSIDPFPDAVIAAGFPGLNSLVQANVQQVELEVFESLKANDILFIDSSHVVKCGSDVNYLLLEVLPRLSPGVLVHFHDIFLPQEFPRAWVVDRHLFWNEQYLLHAFLTFNTEFEVVFANTLMGVRHPNEMRAAFPKSQWWGGGSFWIRRRVS